MNPVDIIAAFIGAFIFGGAIVEGVLFVKNHLFNI